MRLAVVGSRGFDNFEYLAEILDTIHVFSTITLIVSGGAGGADSLAARWATENGVESLEILPDWSKHGRAAGFIRNVEIWNHADEGIAFWDGQSKGTAHSFEIARKQNKPIVICEYAKLQNTEIQKGQQLLF